MWLLKSFFLVFYFIPANGALQEIDIGFNPIVKEYFPRNIIEDILNLLNALPNYLTPTGEGVNQQCQLDGEIYKAALAAGDQWAIQMFDADPKFPQSGLTDGNFIDFPGSFDTCMKADSGSFRGKYCLLGLYTLNINETQPQDRSFFAMPKSSGLIKFATCVPSSCNQDDAALGMTYFLLNSSPPDSNGDMFLSYPLGCQSEDSETEFTSSDWAMISVLVIFGVMISVSTLMDMYQRFLNRTVFSDKMLGVIHGFSAYNNTRKLFDTKPSSENLGCINGIRFISMTWVVVGHTFQNMTVLSGLPMFLTNLFYLLSTPGGPLDTTASAAIWDADNSVDTFFLIGAILLSYLTLKELDKKKGGLQMWAMFYIHRYLRLSGLYAMVIFLHATLLKHLLAYGPQGYALDHWFQGCSDDWWISLLYLNNFNIRGVDEFYGPGCLGHSWYLSVDMQLFIFSPIIIYLLWKYPKFGLILSGIVTLGATLTPLAITWDRDMVYDGWSGDFAAFYTKPWNRIQPYIIGLLVGFFLHKLKNKPKLPINWIVNTICWLVAGAVAATCIYGIANYSIADSFAGKFPELYQQALYIGFNRLAWSLAISWVIIACIKKKGGPINEFLSWSGFVPVARLSYCMYLVHFTIIMWYNSVQKTNVTYSTEVYIYYCLAHVFMTAGVSFVFVVCFEMPILHAEKLLFGLLGVASMPKPRKDEASLTKIETEKKSNQI